MIALARARSGGAPLAAAALAAAATRLASQPALSRSIVRTVGPLARALGGPACNAARSKFAPLPRLIDMAALRPTDASDARESVFHGWVVSVRRQRRVAFVMLQDGSSAEPLQVVLGNPELAAGLSMGTAARVVGRVVASAGAKQRVELHASRVDVLGACDGERYPLQKQANGHSSGHLREHAHLRARTATFAANLRLRSRVFAALARVLEDHERFVRVQAPVITGADCEGAGEMFSVGVGAQRAAGARAAADSAPYFGGAGFLTVSGQLEAEALASGLTRVYTFGPTFRAENSQTSRHLSEFWMLEAEAFFVTDVTQLQGLAQRVVQAAISAVLDEPDARRDLELHDPACATRLAPFARGDFASMTYTEAVAALASAHRDGKLTLASAPEWGMDLSAEHEQFLAQRVVGGPVFITRYPAAIKAFYMRAAEPCGGERAAVVDAFDLLVPSVGELVGGSMREERRAELVRAMAAKGVDVDALEWYLQLREFGTAPHGGFGLGADRLVQWLLGLTSIRDTVPFARYPGVFARHV